MKGHEESLISGSGTRFADGVAASQTPGAYRSPMTPEEGRYRTRAGRGEASRPAVDPADLPILLAGESDILLLCDHASSRVPETIDLGVDEAVMARHVAVDIGAEPLTRALAEALSARAVLATVSRLAIDLHREPDHPALVPLESDGDAVPGNVGADRFERIARFHAPYHRTIAQAIAQRRPTLIVAIHSFTRALRQGGRREMDAGILYNRDDRAARTMIEGLRMAGIAIGDNAPYSGRVLNATLNRHGEANGIASVSIEICNDRIADADGVAEWCALLIPIVEKTRNRLAKVDCITQ
jgi:predicted N-formylglutamate amidohydrolase